MAAQGGGKVGGLELRKSSGLSKVDDVVLDFGEVDGGGMDLGKIDGRMLDLGELRDEEDLPGGEVRGDEHDGGRERDKGAKWSNAVQVGRSGGSASHAEHCGTKPFRSALLILVGSEVAGALPKGALGSIYTDLG